MAYSQEYEQLTRRIAAEEFPDNPALADLFYRMMKQESGFDDDVVEGRRLSSAGAMGIAQFMPDTATGRGVNPLDPEEALRGAAGYLKELVGNFGGDVAKGTAAYNAGPQGVINAVQAGGAGWRDYLPDETKTYLAATGPGGETMTTPDTRLAQVGVTGAPRGEEDLNRASELIRDILENPDDYSLELRLAAQKVVEQALTGAVLGPETVTTTQTYDVQDAQTQRDLAKYKAQVFEGELSLQEALNKISRETAVTSRTETMGREQRAMWDMQLAPGTEYQPGYGPQGVIAELTRRQGGEFQPRPVTTVPSAALSPQTYLEQAQQSIPEIPPMNLPAYPQLLPPSGIGQTTTTTSGFDARDEAIARFKGTSGPKATPSWWTPPMARPEDIPGRIPPNWWEMLQQGR